MRLSTKSTLAAFTLLALAGCGHGDESPNPTDAGEAGASGGASGGNTGSGGATGSGGTGGAAGAGGSTGSGGTAGAGGTAEAGGTAGAGGAGASGGGGTAGIGGTAGASGTAGSGGVGTGGAPQNGGTSAILDAGSGGLDGGPPSDGATGGQSDASAPDADAGPADGGADGGCAAALRDVPAGTYSLNLQNEVYFCSKSTLQCSLTGSEHGPATLTIAATEVTDGLGNPTGTYALDGTLDAPSLNLDTLGTHVETYPGMLLGKPPSSGVWDPSSTETSIHLSDDVCLGLVTFDAPGSVDIDIDRPLGRITSFQRTCELEFMTIYYVTKSVDDGGGTLSCKAP